jgi:fructoselysine-6-P-deglycase FrlB-like protein
LAKTPLLVLSADDGLAPGTDRLVKEIEAAGGTKVTTLHAATDHSWSDHRIYLETTIVNWLATL